MKSVVMLATLHEYQELGNARNSELEKRLDYLISKFGAQVVMEEWFEKQRESVAKPSATKKERESFARPSATKKERESFARAFAERKALATKSAFHWANVGTPDEPQYRTYTGLINYPGYDGSLQPPDWDAPQMYEYGPFENQEIRENQMAKNVQAEMGNYESGLFILGLAHLHSVFGKLQSLGFKVTAFSWLGI